MDYAYRTHKEVPFGWLQALKTALTPPGKGERPRAGAACCRAPGGLA